eukprot:6201407-Pleurochrysis_carterae.AAC.2
MKLISLCQPDIVHHEQQERTPCYGDEAKDEEHLAPFSFAWFCCTTGQRFPHVGFCVSLTSQRPGCLAAREATALLHPVARRPWILCRRRHAGRQSPDAMIDDRENTAECSSQ